MTALVVPWATSAVKTATIGHSVVQTVQLVSLGVDDMVHCLAQLIPAVVLAVVLTVQLVSIEVDYLVYCLVQLSQENTQTSVLCPVVVFVGSVQLLSTLKFPWVVLIGSVH